MKIMKYFVATSPLLFAACNQQNQNAPADNTPTDVTIRVELPKTVSTRAAMGDLQDKVNNNDPATVEKLQVYLTNSGSNIKVAKEIAKTASEFSEITNGDLTSGGYTFTNVDKEVTHVYVIANPSGPLQNVGENLKLTAELKPKVTDAVYAGQANVVDATTTTTVTPTQSGNVKLKSAEVTLDAATNRIQVLGTKFTKIVWKNGKKMEYIRKLAEYMTNGSGSSRTKAEAEQMFKTTDLGGETWDGTEEFSSKTHLSQWFELADITNLNEGILMNRFYTTLTLPSKTIDQTGLMFAQSMHKGVYTTNDGTFKPDGKKDLSEVASYFKAGGFTYNGKAAAFNFFSAGITGYGKDGNAPKVIFAFKEGKDKAGVSADHRFVVVQGYTKDNKAELTDVVNRAGYLLDMDLSKYNNNNGILVELDPQIPSGIFPDPAGQEDLEKTSINLVVKVHVSPWTSVNVLPILN